MVQTISLQEYKSPVWKLLALIALTISTFTFITYLFISNFLVSYVLLGGIFQLISYACFAAAILAFFQFRGESKEIQVNVSKQNLTVDYMLKGRKLKEELFERKTIKKIEKTEVELWWDLLSLFDGNKYIISFTDTKNELSVFTYSGQDLYISAGEAAVLDNFLNEHNLSNVKK